MCRLDCGIDGMLAIQNIADTKIGAVSDVLSEGQTLQVKILRLDREKYFADLTCKESELRHGDTQLRMLPVDRMFDQFEEERSRNEVKKSDKVSHFLRRKINHPLFKNMNGKEATEFLADKTRGELVIRPSNRGVDHLTVTVKLADDFYKHFGKPSHTVCSIDDVVCTVHTTNKRYVLHGANRHSGDGQEGRCQLGQDLEDR